jgi:ABC-type xylose transport system permease subunit
MYIRKSKDFFAGLLFVFFGIAAMALAPHYRIGTAAQMGPGYFPFALGGVLTVLGLCIFFNSLSRKRRQEKTPPFRVRPLVFVLASVLLFGIFLERLGLVLATFCLVVLAGMASEEFRIKEALLNAAVLLGVVLLVFIYFLNFQVPIWPSLISGRP